MNKWGLWSLPSFYLTVDENFVLMNGLTGYRRLLSRRKRTRSSTTNRMQSSTNIIDCSNMCVVKWALLRKYRSILVGRIVKMGCYIQWSVGDMTGPWNTIKNVDMTRRWCQYSQWFYKQLRVSRTCRQC